MSKALQHLNYEGGNFGIASSLINGHNQTIRYVARGAWLDSDPVMVGLENATTISSRWLNNRISSVNGAYIGGHAAYSERLLNMLIANNFKTIQIVRDTRDVIVSFAYWIET